MNRKQKRLSVIGGALLFLGVATGLTLYALGSRASFFYLPTDVVAKGVAPGERIRLGGLVGVGSIERRQGLEVVFDVTDEVETVQVMYNGILPDLFREQQGVVTEGVFGADGTFVADTVLARHDETYMPREVAESLKELGMWQHAGDGDAQPANGAATETGY
ncbi:cytochrome c maturation protein CcmE [Chelativorans sp. ZYF759]|uniref:cytochrome c maturation protein CcmE n=1 Tax=Chelativorans sp. ZYF759 TaxID=2692213 RepID=UPI00145C762F|nr:cytochrome c maturation protein CcmE [Chelativorans sp. ZYF759]NMG38990.1 cytochrome c maturation protein CcmE [Chelativorans sp. ZYF759]